uniref:Uncharacterized protein n=1 Tax=Arundo donax TaxID=35708 RepID=A0A0A9FBS1_ARUDO
MVQQFQASPAIKEKS